ncbi:MAG: hypothetical protein IKP61_04950 [Spirochaetales bacterium]|nr:hypothetical protein [Spirochaetales bacterium]
MKKTLIIVAVIALLLLAACSQDKVSREDFDLMYAHLSQMWAQSLEHADAENAFFGDSRVAGADWYSAYPDKKVINLGVGGDRVGDLIVRIGQVEALAKSGSLKRCFVAIGGNDCLSSKFDDKAFEKEYDELLTKLGDLGIAVYLNTIAGLCNQSSALKPSRIKASNGNMAKANEIIKALAQKHGMQVIDVAKAMNNADGTLKAEYCVEDGVHFSAKGNSIWFEELLPFVD